MQNNAQTEYAVVATETADADDISDTDTPSQPQVHTSRLRWSVFLSGVVLVLLSVLVAPHLMHSLQHGHDLSDHRMRGTGKLIGLSETSRAWDAVETAEPSLGSCRDCTDQLSKFLDYQSFDKAKEVFMKCKSYSECNKALMKVVNKYDSWDKDEETAEVAKELEKAEDESEDDAEVSEAINEIGEAEGDANEAADEAGEAVSDVGAVAAAASAAGTAATVAEEVGEGLEDAAEVIEIVGEAALAGPD